MNYKFIILSEHEYLLPRYVSHQITSRSKLRPSNLLMGSTLQQLTRLFEQDNEIWRNLQIVFQNIRLLFEDHFSLTWSHPKFYYERPETKFTRLVICMHVRKICAMSKGEHNVMTFIVPLLVKSLLKKLKGIKHQRRVNHLCGHKI